jgi:chromate transport protein ChrA
MDEANQTLVTKPEAAKQTSLREIAILFLRSGTMAFGGPGGAAIGFVVQVLHVDG